MSNNNTKKLNKAIFNPCAKNPHNISSANLPMEGAWATLVQWRDHGYAVKKGEHPQRVDWEFNGNPRYYNVYHATQCEALNTAETRKTARKIVELTLEAKAPEKPSKKASAKPAKKPSKKAPEKPTAKAVKPTKKAEKPTAKAVEPENPVAQYAKYMAEIAKRAQEIAPPKAEKHFPKGFDPKAVKLTKGGYYVSTRKGAKWADGYTFEYEGTMFGVAKDDHGVWSVSELSTGLMLSRYGFKSRKGALEDAKDSIDKALSMLKDDLKFEEYKVAIAQAYADAAATDAAMGGC